MITCKKCGTDKDESGFSRNKTTITGYQMWCKDCMHKINQTYKKTSPKNITPKTLVSQNVEVVEKASVVKEKKSSTDWTSINEYAKTILPLLIQYRSTSTVEELGSDALFLAEMIITNNETNVETK